MSVISSPVPGVFAHFSSSIATPLFKDFCKCEAAKALLASDVVKKPLHLYLYPGDRSKVTIDDLIEADENRRNITAVKSSFGLFHSNLQSHSVVQSAPKSSHISSIHLSEKIVDNWTKGLQDLAFIIYERIFSDDFFAAFLRFAKKGDVGMDDYAQTMQKKMILQERGAYQLIKKCIDAWGVKFALPDFEAHELDTQADLEIALFARELNCQTNDFRREWIERYQKVYCAQHPKSDFFCSVTKNDLCDLNEVHKKYRSAQEDFIAKRLCHLFPKADEKVKNYSPYRDFYQHRCKPVGPNQFQAASISFVVGLAAAFLGYKCYPS